MQVVGIDFGTTNVRISTWDPDQDQPPEPKSIGTSAQGQGVTIMPALITLQRHQDGGVSYLVDGELVPWDIRNNTPVTEELPIENIKRYALSGDACVDWHLEHQTHQGQGFQWPEQWWNQEKGCVEQWGLEFPVWDLIRLILSEAFRRADLSGEIEWRAGCPVHANFQYRASLAQVLFDLTGKSNVNWIIEEPILVLTLARQLGNLDEGSYMVYDIGGGSFDCALVEIEQNDMHVYGADGHPLLGGSDIDRRLTQMLGYTGPPDLMRQTKERLNSSNPSDILGQGTVVTLENVESTLRDGKFGEKSISTMWAAYVAAKVLWKRPSDLGGDEHKDDPPIGEILTQKITRYDDDETPAGRVKFVWQSTWDDIAQDVDGIILFGGPTRSPYFSRYLSNRFPEAEIKTISEILPTLTGTPDLELVGVSMGACYSYRGSYAPLYISRVPARITLQDLRTGQQVAYEPYQHFEYQHREYGPRRTSKPFQPYFSECLAQEKSDPHGYELTVTYPSLDNEVIVKNPDGSDARYTIDGYLRPSEAEREEMERQGTSYHPRLPATSLRLVIDRFGRVGVEKHSSGPGSPWTEMFFPVKNPPWQLPDQREKLQHSLAQQAMYEERRSRRGSHNINRLPWNYPTA